MLRLWNMFWLRFRCWIWILGGNFHLPVIPHRVSHINGTNLWVLHCPSEVHRVCLHTCFVWSSTSFTASRNCLYYQYSLYLNEAAAGCIWVITHSAAATMIHGRNIRNTNTQFTHMNATRSWEQTLGWWHRNISFALSWPGSSSCRITDTSFHFVQFQGHKSVGKIVAAEPVDTNNYVWNAVLKLKSRCHHEIHFLVQQPLQLLWPLTTTYSSKVSWCCSPH